MVDQEYLAHWQQRWEDNPPSLSDEQVRKVRALMGEVAPAPSPKPQLLAA